MKWKIPHKTHTQTTVNTTFTDVPPLTTSIQYYAGSPSVCKTPNSWKRKKTELSYSDNIITYVENPKESKRPRARLARLKDSRSTCQHTNNSYISYVFNKQLRIETF